MSTADSPAIAALKARLEKHSAGQDGTQKLKGSPPLAIASANRTPPLKPKAGSGSPHSKKLTKQLDAALSQGQKGGFPGKSGHLTPPSKVKTSSQGSGRGLVKDGWQHKTHGSPSVSQHQDKSALASILQARPHLNQTGGGEKRGEDADSSQVRSKPLTPRNKGHTRSVEISSKGVAKERENWNRLSSVENSMSGEEEACPLDKVTGVKRQKKFVIECRNPECLDSSVSSNEGDSCDIQHNISPGSSSCGLPREGELTASRSEENISSLVLTDAKQGRSLSLLYDEHLTPDHKKKPLPMPQKKAPPVCDISSLPSPDVIKTSPTSYPTSSKQVIQNPSVPMKPKPGTVGAKPTVSREKVNDGVLPTTVSRPTCKPPVSSSKPAVSKTKPALPGKKPAVASIKPKISPNKPNLRKPIDDRRKPPLPPTKVNDRNSTKQPGRQNFSAPHIKPSSPGPLLPLKPPHVSELQDNPVTCVVRERSSSPEIMSLDSREVKDIIGSSTDNTVSGNVDSLMGNKGAAKEELEETLTGSQSCDLETTLVEGTGEMSGEWVMLGKKKGDDRKEEEGCKDASVTRTSLPSSNNRNSKKLPTPPSKPATNNQQTSNSTETESKLSSSTTSSSGSPSSGRKPLPSLPSRESPTFVEQSSPQGASPKSPRSNKVSALMAKFGTTSPSSSTGQTVSGKSEEEDDRPKSPAVVSKGLKPLGNVAVGETTPSVVSPTVRIIPEPSRSLLSGE